jgi:hypothetical protein
MGIEEPGVKKNEHSWEMRDVEGKSDGNMSFL